MGSETLKGSGASTVSNFLLVRKYQWNKTYPTAVDMWTVTVHYNISEIWGGLYAYVN